MSAIRQLVPATRISEGAGVTVNRTIGTPALRHLDPFLMLDYFNNNHPDDYIAGFPDHPHRGFVTLTYMLDGHMLHEDSMGNRGDLRAGGAQWMKAASGVIHSEMPQQSDGRMRGFQLWINLPAAEKMSDPAYQEFGRDRIPTVDANGVQVKILSGEYAGQRGPINDPLTELQYLDVTLAPGRTFAYALAADRNGLVYVFEGGADADDGDALADGAAVLSPGDTLTLRAQDAGARLLLITGRPVREPIVQYGPFVMNTNEEIHQAFADYRAGTLVRARPRVHA
jgi:hypothetical protein